METVITGRKEFYAGARAILPLLVAVIPVGAVFGAAAVTTGLTVAEAVLMSALVFAGGSQFVAMDIWTHPASWSGIGFAALLVNLRHVLMGASIAGKMQRFTRLQTLGAMPFLADELWAMSEMRARSGFGLSPAWYAGIVAPFYAAWVVSTLTGALVGNVLGDPVVVGLDFAFPAVFIVLILGFWKGRSTAAVIVASALSALLVRELAEGVWYILAGAGAGLVCAALGSAAGGDAE
jgi:Predicted branched-chain amino acid permease (azaleucine resistance)